MQQKWETGETKVDPHWVHDLPWSFNGPCHGPTIHLEGQSVISNGDPANLDARNDLSKHQRRSAVSGYAAFKKAIS